MSLPLVLLHRLLGWRQNDHPLPGARLGQQLLAVSAVPALEPHLEPDGLPSDADARRVCR